MTLFDITYDDFKREDTTNVITITLYTDDKQPITPNASHTWKAKVAKGDKYVGEYPVTISGNTIKLSSSNLTRLPNGDYGLELWETYSGSTTIYPSAGVMEFRVHRNANDTLGTVDPTTDINGIIDDLHKAGQNIKVVATNTLPAGSKASVTQSITNGENQLTFNIPQGIQGEKGEVGPAPTLKIGTVTKLNPDQTPTANLSGGNGSYTLNLGIPQGVQGETDPTATQALDIANSVNDKVTAIKANGGGRNLAIGTAFKKCDIPNYASDGGQISLDALKSLRGQWITISCDMNWTGFVRSTKCSNRIGYELGLNYSDGTRLNINNWYSPSDSEVDKSFRFGRSWKLPDKDLESINQGLLYNQIIANTCVTSELMIEKGTVAHDWQPAPEDVDNYASGRTIALPKNSSITVKDDRIIPYIKLPMYFTDYTPVTNLDYIADRGECDNLFVPSDTMATLTNRPINPDTKAFLTGDCFFTSHYAYSGTTLRAFQKFYSCDYNYVFVRSYNGSSKAWSGWSCLALHA